MDIKVEDNKYEICGGCLSSDRVISPTVDIRLFFTLLGDQMTDASKVLLCWECNAKLRKVQQFQNQIKHAQVALLQYFYQTYAKPISSSSLTVVVKEGYDANYTYCDAVQVVPTPPVLDIVKEELDEKDDPDMINRYTPKDENYIPTKDEYSPCTSDIDTFDTIDKPTKKKSKKKSSNTEPRLQSIKQYEKYATVVIKQVIPRSDLSKFYESVVMSESEIEDLLVKHRKRFGYYKLPFSCAVCVKKYKNKKDLNRHCDLNHKTSPPFRCAECRRVCKNAFDLKDHWKRHSELARCLTCREVCRSRGELRKHLNRDHTKLYCCNLCDVQCCNLRKFSQHYQHQHERFICDYCSARFTAKHFLERHMILSHMPPSCGRCGLRFASRSSLRRHRALHAAPDIREAAYCVECDKQFPSVYKYRSHIKSSPKHTPQPKIRIPCPDCGKIFTRKTYMKNHHNQVHSKTMRHYCGLCNKILITAFALRNHMKHVHEKKTLPRNKICDLCGRGFSTNRILINHIRTHTGERPYKCAYCPASFAQQTAMKSHEKSQHLHHAQNTFVL